MKLNESTVEGAQQRGGGRQVDRDSQIDDILNSNCLGHNNGDPLVGDDYSSYPDFNELAQPRWISFLRELFSHKLVNNFEEARLELTGVTADSMVDRWEESIENASQLSGMDVQALFEEGETVSTDSKLTQILDYKPAEQLKDCENPLLVAELYTEGLSVEEIAKLLEGDGAQVRDSLKTAGLLEGKTQQEQSTSFEKNKGRLGSHGDSGGGGLTVNTRDL